MPDMEILYPAFVILIHVFCPMKSSDFVAYKMQISDYNILLFAL